MENKDKTWELFEKKHKLFESQDSFKVNDKIQKQGFYTFSVLEVGAAQESNVSFVRDEKSSAKIK